MTNNILRNTKGKMDAFSPQMVLNNYRRMDTIYQKRLGITDLDARLFLKEKTIS